jgi:TIR domain
MPPRLTLLAPEHFCRDPKWGGTTNIFHVFLHDAETPDHDVAQLVSSKKFDFGLSLPAPFSPPRWTRDSEMGLLVSLHTDIGTVQPYRIPSGGPRETAVAALTRLKDGVDVASFILRVPQSYMGDVSIRARVVVSGVVLAEITAVFPTAHHGAETETRQRRMAFTKIFASYARTDLAVVKLFDAVISALAVADLKWDLKFLRSGDDWREGIRREILEADSFQLFWSKAASESPNVRDEWMFALGNREKGFIKPIYWNEPLIPPPPELSYLHFGKVEVASLAAVTSAM